MERELTCIVCPLGCTLSVTLENGTVTRVTGNTCPKGKRYAETECINPMRTVTSTVRCTDGSMVAVKTQGTIPKEKMAECMNLINSVIAPLPIQVGDVIIGEVFGTKIVATQNRG
ncbi:MAG: DUF1667 domain-containing protein [Ruminococcaceae bacterium]|nr:DUF1667 domain-containing protein [Oscillospiraceae bacterium]